MYNIKSKTTKQKLDLGLNHTWVWGGSEGLSGGKEEPQVFLFLFKFLVPISISITITYFLE